MATEKITTPYYRDMLDIIFANRNKTYGAYQLRRDYPQYLGRALLIGLALIVFFLALPTLLKAFSDLRPEAPVTNVIAELGPPPDIDPNKPTPPPVPPPTPPPAVRPTTRFVPLVVLVDEDVPDEQPKAAIADLIDDNKDIGAKNNEGDEDAPPTTADDPGLGKVEAAVAPEPEETFELFNIQKQPAFPGGDKEMYKYLADNIVYPSVAKDNGIQGTIPVKFVVNKDGSISDVEVLRDPSGGSLGKEAMRVIKAMPPWLPGEANGHPVKVRYTLPIKFKLE